MYKTAMVAMSFSLKVFSNRKEVKKWFQNTAKCKIIFTKINYLHDFVFYILKLEITTLENLLINLFFKHCISLCVFKTDKYFSELYFYNRNTVVLSGNYLSSKRCKYSNKQVNRGNLSIKGAQGCGILSEGKFLVKQELQG